MVILIWINNIYIMDKYFNEIPKNGDLLSFKPVNCEVLEYDIK